MAIKSYSVKFGANPLMPAAGDTVNSTPFEIPDGTYSLTIFIPDLAGAGTVKVQSLQPKSDLENAAESWSDVKYFSDAGTLVAVALLTENSTITLPAWICGGGVLRLVSTVDQSASPLRIPIVFHMCV